MSTLLNVAKSLSTMGQRKEKFTDVGTSDLTPSQSLLMLLVLVVLLVLYALIGSWLYNNVGCAALTILKPITPLTFIGLSILISMLTC